MAMRMLIDARHPEETRVAVLNGNRIEEFDFESAERKQIKGNIFLAKVTRVEPSLQAAFVDFGGNRHGFLAFSEIHPDYYQIPAADRAALLAEEQEHADEEAALRDAEDENNGASSAADEEEEDDLADADLEPGVEEIDTSEKDEVATIEDGRVANGDGDGDDEPDDQGNGAENSEADGGDGDGRPARGRRNPRARRQGRGNGGERGRAKEMEELRAKRQALRRRYKIQDVIQRRQVLLVQVVKEERGNKGAALTTYLSLAGRYCVLMPNSSHGGGISRKISSGQDRNRLKQIVSELSLPRSMGLIVRTAGLQRTKTEIKRDFDYLARLWDEIREKTLASSAPALIHSDSDLIKRAIRDIYNRDIEEVVVEGEEGYRAAKQFMKLLMPSHARRVKAYSDPVPLFQRYGAEDQLSAMYDPVVQLKSGGYLVINPTEALVSIDINSGRSTKEHGIEQTALNTNLEAAREIARQLRLRDMAGLVVIDFIDMEHNSNVRKVERAMKDALKHDRARIQIGRISGFGLMEMSRQRLRTGVLEATTRSCPHCDGIGLVRTASSAGLSALRLIEDEAAKGKGTLITLFASTEAAVYLLNAKRADLAEIESRYGVSVEVVPEGEEEGAKMRIQSGGPRPAEMPKFAPIPDEDYGEELAEDEELEDEEDDEVSAGEAERSGAPDRKAREEEDEGQRKKRRRRRRGGRGRNRDREQDGEDSPAGDSSKDEGAEEIAVESAETGNEEEDDQQRRRRRRGGRRRKQSDTGDEDAAARVPEDGRSDIGPPEDAAEAAIGDSAAAGDEPIAAEEPGEKAIPRPRRKSPQRSKAAPAVEEEVPLSELPAGDETSTAEAKPKRRRSSRKKDEEGTGESPKEAPEPEPAPATAATSRTVEAAQAQPATAPGELETAIEDEDEDQEGVRRGWWQRTFGP